MLVITTLLFARHVLGVCTALSVVCCCQLFYFDRISENSKLYLVETTGKCYCAVAELQHHPLPVSHEPCSCEFTGPCGYASHQAATDLLSFHFVLLLLFVPL